MKKYLFTFIIIIAALSSTWAQSQKMEQDLLPADSNSYTTEIVVPELDIPWGMAWLPNGDILIAEKDGRLLHWHEGKKTEISGVPEVYTRGQGGLLDLELHPNYAENGWVYITYSSTQGEEKGGFTALMRGKIKDGALVEQEVLYKGGPNTTKGHHYGSRIEFDRDGFVYFSIGDRGNRDENPQDITRDGGKIYRLNDDGTIPADNPFVDSEGAKSAIYSYGHRNPQGVTMHPETGEIWVHEHGPRGGDEINIVQKGKNFGWPVITYGINYSGTKITDETSKEGMEQPLAYWLPSIAPSGMDFVTSDKYPAWQGSLLAGSLKFSYLERLVFDESGKLTHREKLLPDMGRIRNVRQAPDGYLYAAVEGTGIVKIVPVPEK